MPVHRFRDLLESHTETPVAGSTSDAFVAMPVLVGAGHPSLAQIQEIYRQAAERTQAQFQPRRSRMPEYSLN